MPSVSFRLTVAIALLSVPGCELFVGDLPSTDTSAQTGPQTGQDGGPGGGSSAGGVDTSGSGGTSGSSGSGSGGSSAGGRAEGGSGGNLATGGDGGTSAGDGGAANGGTGAGGASTGGVPADGGAPGAGGVVLTGGTPGAGGAGTGGTGTGGAGAGGAGAGGASTGGSLGAGGCCDCDGDGQNSKACGGPDCDDGDEAVYHGETAYQPLASTHGSFDYDCSNTLDRDPALDKIVDCTSIVNILLCSQKVGFIGTAPVCGAQGDWGTCKAGTLSCVPDIQGKMTMTCR
ncbi:MAG TPA: hypothetical protein VHE30_20200 [Polyangiaceae bacterium]|nr:hypothetical protein [Polyangiaceae bacterium]